MPRYYFHLRNDVQTNDEEGTELASLAAAREAALDNCRTMVCESVKLGHLNLDHYILVEDDAGHDVLKVTFREAFTIEG